VSSANAVSKSDSQLVYLRHALAKGNHEGMPVLYMLVGIPCSGKTTFRHNYFGRQFVHLSTDDIIESVADLHNKSYTEFFPLAIDPAQKLVENLAKKAVEQQKPVIWDQTNLSAKSRARKLEMFLGYYKVAYVFSVPKNLEARLNEPHRRANKFISRDIIDRMIVSFEEVTKEEGFDEITVFPPD